MSINRSRDTDLTRSLSFYIPVSVSVNIGKPRNYLCRCVTRYRVSQMGRGNRERSFRYNLSRKVLACVRSTLLRSIIDKLEVFPKYTEETCVSRSTIGTRFECFTLDELSVKKEKKRKNIFCRRESISYVMFHDWIESSINNISFERKFITRMTNSIFIYKSHYVERGFCL